MSETTHPKQQIFVEIAAFSSSEIGRYNILPDGN